MLLRPPYFTRVWALLFLHIPFSGGERDRYYATDIDNAFTEEASSSATDFYIDTFLVEKGKRISANFYREPNRVNLPLIPFVE